MKTDNDPYLTVNVVAELIDRNMLNDALVFLFHDIENHLSADDIPYVNALLVAFGDRPPVHPQIMSGLLRSTSRAKHLLVSWIPVRNKLHDQLLTTHRLDVVHRVFRGLYPRKANTK